MIHGVLKSKAHQWSLSARIGAPGKPVGRTSGGWVHELMALGKAVMLCFHCENKLGKADLLKYGYQKIKDIVGYDHVIGDCDGCRSKYVQCRFFQKRPAR